MNVCKVITAVPKPNLFSSPPDKPFSTPGVPIIESAHFVKPVY